MNDESLVAEMKSLLLARRREDPLVIAMSSDVKQIRTELYGQAKCVNLALGNSREAVDTVAETKKEITALQTTVAAQNETISDMKAALVVMGDRLDKASEWLKTKGMK